MIKSDHVLTMLIYLCWCADMYPGGYIKLICAVCRPRGTGGNATLHYYCGKYAVSTDCIVLLPNDRIRCKYLYYFFLANMRLLEAGFKGAGLKHTNKKYIN